MIKNKKMNKLFFLKKTNKKTKNNKKQLMLFLVSKKNFITLNDETISQFS